VTWRRVIRIPMAAPIRRLLSRPIRRFCAVPRSTARSIASAASSANAVASPRSESVHASEVSEKNRSTSQSSSASSAMSISQRSPVASTTSRAYRAQRSPVPRSVTITGAEAGQHRRARLSLDAAATRTSRALSPGSPEWITDSFPDGPTWTTSTRLQPTTFGARSTTRAIEAGPSGWAAMSRASVERRSVQTGSATTPPPLPDVMAPGCPTRDGQSIIKLCKTEKIRRA
jgi:hypothetical protein